VIVDGFNALLRALISAHARLFEPTHPLVGLAAASLLTGVAMLLVVGKTSNQRAIERAKKRMQAHLLEMRLFRDEPSLLFRAQGNLLLNNARYVGHMLRPALFLTLPMIVLYAHLDAVYGRRPLRVGESALLAADTELDGTHLSLVASAGFEVDSVSVTAPESGQVVWRIRATGEGVADLALETPQGTVTKKASAGDGELYVSASRTSLWWERLLLSPGESGYVPRTVRSVGIAYPPREIGIGDWEAHWVVWFLGISILSAFLLKGPFGIAL
jgi:uncharacterized membrane protein (DUF106 family)